MFGFMQAYNEYANSINNTGKPYVSKETKDSVYSIFKCYHAETKAVYIGVIKEFGHRTVDTRIKGALRTVLFPKHEAGIVTASKQLIEDFKKEHGLGLYGDRYNWLDGWVIEPVATFDNRIKALTEGNKLVQTFKKSADVFILNCRAIQ